MPDTAIAPVFSFGLSLVSTARRRFFRLPGLLGEKDKLGSFGHLLPNQLPATAVASHVGGTSRMQRGGVIFSTGRPRVELAAWTVQRWPWFRLAARARTQGLGQAWTPAANLSCCRDHHVCAELVRVCLATLGIRLQCRRNLGLPCSLPAAQNSLVSGELECFSQSHWVSDGGESG